ncbi:MAG: helix-turn-helix domain-containing protein [Candidatus Poribacteria bacterium]|nr:helix-turn-helix domain-containing protein [Candidatus Poribacteria bacterium]
MPKRVSTKQLLMACQMSFDGKSNREIASELGFSEATVSNWRKLKIWQEFETELIDAYKKQALNPEGGTPS